MEVKIDTKEKFTVITPILSPISANIAANLATTCNSFLLKAVKNVILNLEMVSAIDEKAAETIASLQQGFYEKSASFVICCMQPAVSDTFEQLELLELLNVTPSESEAWDIVQMEEIERELLDGDNSSFESNT